MADAPLRGAAARSRARSRARGRSLRAGALAFALLAAGPAGAQGGYDEGLEPVDPGRLLPQALIASGQHRVVNARRVGPHTIAFDIESEAAGVQSAVSIPLALVRIQEAQALTQAVDQFRQDTRRAADEGRGRINVRGDSLVDIVTSPLSTSAEVVGQFGRNVGQTLDELGEFPGPGGGAAVAANTGSDDPVLASHRRNVASQLGLDVHSSNPAVQRFLAAMARARAGGSARAGITTVSVARPEVAIDGGRLEERIRSAVLNEERGELFERDLGLLEAAGVSQELARRFLEHPVLTPTHKSAITQYVHFLDGVRNRGARVEAALDARDEVEALAKVQIARMYAYYHEAFTPLAELVPAGHLALGVNSDGALLVALPFDVLPWTPDSDRVFSSLAEFAGRKGVSDRVVLLTGVASARAGAALEERAFRVFERFLFRR